MSMSVIVCAFNAPRRLKAFRKTDLLVYWQFGDSERNTSYEGRSVDAQKCFSFYYVVHGSLRPCLFSTEPKK
jgi:hypothetical protein